MEHVDVRELAAGPRHAMKEIARLEQRGVERLAVEADERAGARERARDGADHRPLVGKARQQERPRDKRSIVVEPAAADEKRLRAGATAQAGGLEIEEYEWCARVPAAIERGLGRGFIEA